MTKGIKYVSVQLQKGVPFMYCYMVDGCDKVITKANFNKDNKVTYDLYPFAKLPQEVKDFMIDTDTKLTWFGSSGDNTIMRFLPKH